MKPISIVCHQNTNAEFLQTVVQTGSTKDFSVNIHSQPTLDSSKLLEAIHTQTIRNPNGIIILVSTGQYEIAPEFHEILAVLPIHYFPAFSAVLGQKSQNCAAAFTQAYAGRLNTVLLVVIPEQIDLVPPLFELLQQTGVLFDDGLRPTVMEEVGAVPDETIVEPAKPVNIQTSQSQPTPSQEESESPPKSKASWKSAMRSLQLILGPDIAGLPEELSSIPAAYAVFEQAGERRYASDHYGNKFGVYGFPDLKRPGSKVLIVRPGAPYPEIIVLHRHPFKVGLIPTHHSNYLISSQESVEKVSLKITKRECKGDRVVAVESNVVYIQRGEDIIRWDGRRESDMGTIRQAIASLILQWSQR